MLVLYITLAAQCLHLAMAMPMGAITSTDTPLSGSETEETNMCKPLRRSCDKMCINGFATDDNGCVKCECFSPPNNNLNFPGGLSNMEITDDNPLNTGSNKCPPLTCHKVCSFGYMVDKDGCFICKCAKPMCIVAGDPFYTTFDEEKIIFQGRCKYMLSATNSTRLPKSLTNFQIYVKNTKAIGSERSYTDLVHIEIDLHRISIKDFGQVTIDDLPRTEDAENGTITDIEKLAVWKEENIVHFVASGMFRVSADLRGPTGRHHVKVVILNPGYRSHMQGMCGNFNQDGYDDRYPKGMDKPSGDVEVGNSWIIDSTECF